MEATYSIRPSTVVLPAEKGETESNSKRINDTLNYGAGSIRITPPSPSAPRCEC